MIKCTY